MKTCSRCGKEHEADTKFCPSCLDIGRRYRNGPRGQAWQRNYYSRNKDKIKACSAKNHYKRTYGITQEEFQAKVAQQNGLCANCGEPPPGNRPLCVDHCHVTGKVRELLCDGCNIALAQAKESERILYGLIAYIRKHAT